MTNFGANLKAARLSANVTQQQMADQFGITRGAVAQWEAGTIYPDASRLGAIAEYLDCSLDVLFRGHIEAAGDPEPPSSCKFWMVYGVGKRGPSYRHWSVTAATAEARRLAETNPGSIFVVMEALCAVKADKPNITAIEVREDAGIPF